MKTISKARLVDAYNEGWNNGRKRTGSHFYGLGHLPPRIEAEYARGLAEGKTSAPTTFA